MALPRCCIAVAFLLLGLSGQAAADRLYKWVDAQGRVHYSDTVPPDAAGHEREVKSRTGVTLQRIEAAKTPDQIEAERRAREREEAKRRAEEEAARKQAAADRTLLLTFSSAEEIERARDDRVAVIDGQITLAEGRIEALRQQLQQAQQQAATIERTGRGDLQQAHQRIRDLERQIGEHQSYLAGKRQERQALIERFAADLARFKELQAERASTSRPPR